MRHMHFRYRGDKKAFLREYNQQRRIEVFFSKLKRRFGSSLRSRIGTTRRREVWLRILILNMLVVAGERMEEELKVAGWLCVTALQEPLRARRTSRGR